MTCQVTKSSHNMLRQLFVGFVNRSQAFSTTSPRLLEKFTNLIDSSKKNRLVIEQKRSFNLTNDSKFNQEDQVKEQKKRNEEVQDMTELIRDFLDPGEFFRAVKTIANIDFFTGVPDSLLKDFCAYVTANAKPENHIIAANEGASIGLATGYHLATGRTPLVYLQNSGLGNTINPIMSLASPSVYSIPILLLIGWRGEPGKRDEPQHMFQGAATPGMLASLNVPFQVLPDYQEGAEQALATAKQFMDSSKGPYCLLVKRQTFLPYKLPKKEPLYKFNREQVLRLVVEQLNDRDIVVSTTGMLSRELFELRSKRNQGHEKDFLTVGCMGHASAIAKGIAMSKSSRQVFCLDGDGASLMHMGTMATIGQQGTQNLKHIVFNNGVHDSVGGQPTDAASSSFSFTQIALGCGYKEAVTVQDEADIIAAVKHLRETRGPALLEIKCNSGHRKNLGRPTRKPIENKSDFMHFLAIN